MDVLAGFASTHHAGEQLGRSGGDILVTGGMSWCILVDNKCRELAW